MAKLTAHYKILRKQRNDKIPCKYGT